jgi:hypothetical protein
MASTKIFSPGGAPGSAGLLAQNTAGGAAAVLPATQTVLNTTETVILNPSLASATQALILSIPSGSALDGKNFEVVASGLLNNGTSSTVNIKLYSGTSTTVGSDTALGASGAVTAFAGKSNWTLKANLIFDTTSGKLTGSIKFSINNVFVAETALSAIVTGIANSSSGQPVLNFVLSVTFASAGTQVITVNQFDANF